MEATWRWRGTPVDYPAANARLLDTMLEVFATTYSHSVQDSLYRMGLAALDAVPDIAAQVVSPGDTADDLVAKVREYLRGGVRLAARDLDGDGKAEVLTGAGVGNGSRVAVYRGSTLNGNVAPATADTTLDAFAGFGGGVFVG